MADDEHREGAGWLDRSLIRIGAAAPETVTADAESWIEADLPRRPWIVRGYLMQGSVTLVSGAGSAGKSMLVLGWACALALGRPWGRFGAADLRIPHTVALYNVEDDLAEQRLRLSAALRQWGASAAEVAPRIVRLAPDHSGLLLDFDSGSGAVSPRPRAAALRQHIEQYQPDVVVCDPLVELHSAGENDNTALRAVVAWFRSLAVEYRCAVVLVHHARKGAHDPGDADSIRGASAVVGAARVALTMQVMREEEADELGIPQEHRRRFSRADGAKSNYAPAREAEWFEQVEHCLANSEWVSALVPWTLPSQTAAPPVTLTAIIADIERGTADGEPWSPKLSGDARSVRTLLARHGARGKKGEAETIRAMDDLGVFVSEFRNAARNRKQGYRTEHGPPANWVEKKTD